MFSLTRRKTLSAVIDEMTIRNHGVDTGTAT